MATRSMLLLAIALLSCSEDRRPTGPPLTVSAAPARAQHVVIVSLDGLRPDAIDRAPARNIQVLVLRGAHCASAHTIQPSITLPSHTSMLTGLDTPRHQVLWNGDTTGTIPIPTIFSAAKGMGRRTAMLYSKSKLRYLARPESLDFDYGPPPGGDIKPASELAKVFAQEWSRRPFHLVFVHLSEPDRAGHLHGWMSEEYLKAVAEADFAVGEIVEAIRASGLLDRTVMILSADHGGSGDSHHAELPENVTIPWICAGPGVPPGLRIDRCVKTYDTAATALMFLGLEPKNIDGTPVTEVLPPLPADKK